MSKAYLDKGILVANFHKKKSDEISSTLKKNKATLDASILSSEDIILKYKKRLPSSKEDITSTTKTELNTKSWEEIVEDANLDSPENLTIENLLSDKEIELISAKHEKIGADLSWFNSIDKYDASISVVAGLLSGLIDVFLVQVPAHAGFLGSEASEGGWLSNKVKEKFGEILPEDKIKELEKLYTVSYDPSTSAKLDIKVDGLGPRTHRYQSIGHDPILGFIFGIKDLLRGEFTAIDKFGKVIIQSTTAPILEGENLIIRLIESLKTVAGHLASDVATTSGLPAPLMPLLSFLQFGSIGDKNYTIAEIARLMYRSGYDFRHFIASSLPLAISEFIVRLGFTIKRLHRGYSLKDSIPNASNTTLRRQLLICHATSGLINAGKVYITKNPLSISWPLILLLLRYSYPELKYLFFGEEAIRSSLVEKDILDGYKSLNSELDQYFTSDSRIKI
ncbi:hypothetical protein H5158_06310 [Pseudoalteromonas sp. SR45-6]|uniref:hypothetical protein n=1 Tax=Pseudoalteromonas sp. SR45-6 TaxID=2760927 RepID=UPI0015FF9474|nr:hypothetical protein [Pseudoalteromonas sp. SR45-6]MBB1341253.1 hypothetical protein [Pseudoalteromonas sp. SR45-6]